jgi:hypothetical protein
MTFLTITIQAAVVAFLAWGGMLSLQCVIRPAGIGFPGREPKLAGQAA